MRDAKRLVQDAYGFDIQDATLSPEEVKTKRKEIVHGLLEDDRYLCPENKREVWIHESIVYGGELIQSCGTERWLEMGGPSICRHGV